MRIVTRAKILAASDEIAEKNRSLLSRSGAIAVNIMGAPGAGKTTLIEALVREIDGRRRLAIIEGDLATTHDAERLQALGVKVVQIHTADACHLEAGVVAAALDEIRLGDVDFVLIENVGNLICPSSFRLGEQARLVVLSATQGDDKVAKYPPMFRACDAVAVTKADLLEHLSFDIKRVREDVLRLSPEARLFEVSGRSGAGVGVVAEWLSGLKAE